MGNFRDNTPLNTSVNLWRNVLVTGTCLYLVKNYPPRLAVTSGIALSAMAGLCRGAFDLTQTHMNVDPHLHAKLALHDPIVHAIDVALLLAIGNALSPTQDFPIHLGKIPLGCLTLVWSTLRIAGLHGQEDRTAVEHGKPYTDSPRYALQRLRYVDLPNFWEGNRHGSNSFVAACRGEAANHGVDW